MNQTVRMIAADGITPLDMLALDNGDGTYSFAAVAPAPELKTYRFLAGGAGQTVTGFYVDAQGQKVGASFSLSLNAADGSNDSVGLPNIPPTAVGAWVRFSGTTYVSFGLGTDDDFEDNYARFPSYASTDGNVALGRVIA